MHKKCVADIQPACELWRGDTDARKASSKEQHFMHHSQIFREIWHLKLNYVTVIECWLLEKIGERFWKFWLCFITPGLLKNLLHILGPQRKSLLPLEKIQQFKMGWVYVVTGERLFGQLCKYAAMQTQLMQHKVQSQCPVCRSFPLIPYHKMCTFYIVINLAHFKKSLKIKLLFLH